METRFRWSRDNIPEELKDFSTWPSVDTTLLSSDDRELFDKHSKAVERYVAGESPDAIGSDLGMDRTEIWRYYNECMQTHSDGRIYGYRALIPRKRMNGYMREKEIDPENRFSNAGWSGMLMKLFDEYPDIQERVDTLFLKKFQKGIVHESRMPVKAIHKAFLTSCIAHGRKERNKYPFNTLYRGYRSLATYLRTLFDRETEKALRARHGKRAAQSAGTGQTSHLEPATEPLERVECDGVMLNAIWVIDVPDLILGGYKTLVLGRLWVVFLIDVVTRAILGYRLSLNRKYTQYDVMQAIKSAVVPQKLIEKFRINGLSYRPGAGLPSAVIPQMEWAVFTELWVDNDKANLANHVINNISRAVGCVVNAGPVGTPERRPFIESFNRLLGENGFNRLPSTTGKNIMDTQSDEPTEKALRYHISLPDLNELLDVAVADYNATPHSGLHYQTPNERLEYLCSKPETLIRKLPPEKRHEICWLDLRETRTIRMSKKWGKRPYVQYEGVKYRNELIANTPSYANQEVTIYIDPFDLRTIRAYIKNGENKGEDIGVLTAQGAWGRTPHTLEMRKAINRLRVRKLISYTDNDDPIMVYLAYLADRAPSDRRDLSRYASVLEYFREHFNFAETPEAAVETVSKCNLEAFPDEIESELEETDDDDFIGMEE